MSELKKSWVITLEEADDGSGDLVLPFTDEILESAGWKTGDTLEWIDNKDGSWILRKKEDVQQETSLDEWTRVRREDAAAEGGYLHSEHYFDTERNK